MSFIALWLLKRKYKKKIAEIKRASPHMTDEMALASAVGGDLKGVKRKILIINIAMVTLFMAIIISVMLVITSAFSFASVMTSLAGNTITEIFSNDDAKNADKTKDGWSWDKKDGTGTGDVTGPGGLYPKDLKLRLRAELIEIMAKGTADAEKEKGTKVEVAWMLGTMYRETGDSLYSNLDNSKVSSLFKDLLVINPACGKGGVCKYVNNGISHFYGGSVSGGVDKGDPYKQVVNTSQSTYNSNGGDHAIGYIQFEIPYIYGKDSEFNKVYGNPTPVTSSTDSATAQSQVKMDNDLGFIRPNLLFIPDAMYNGAFSLARKPTISGSNYNSVINSSDFKSLSEYNQNYLKFVYASAGYGRGHITASDDEMILALIGVAKSKKIEFLDDMVQGVSSKYWDSKSMSSQGDRNTFANYVNSTYGLGMSSDRVAWYGVYAGCVGKVAYTEMTKAIAAAEKIQIGGGGTGSANGNWVGKPGSGKFGDSGSKYFISDIGIRWYNQSSAQNNYSSTWGGLTLLPNSNMATGGCGIYTLAMIASNLENKDITPDVALAALEGKYQERCLTDAGVPFLANKLGMKSKTINFESADIMDKVKAELAKGNMILFVSMRGPYPWYNGAGHFMAIRGMTDDGKLLGISSVGCGSSGMTAQELMKVPITSQVWLDSLSRNRNYVWSVGLNVD